MKALRWFIPVFHLVKKEFRQILRDRKMLRIILFMPIMQLLVLGYAATTDLKDIRLTILDQDNSPDSRRMAEAFFQNNLFVHGPAASSPAEMREHLFRGRADVTVWIPRGYANDLAAGRTAEIALAVDGVNSNAAGRTLGYAQAVVRQEEARLLQLKKLSRPDLKIHRVDAVSRFFYNPELESRSYMIPGIAVILETIISAMLTGMAIVREKEIGTLEQLLVTPLSPRQLIAGKLIPFAVLAMLELGIVIPLAVFWFHLPVVGSLLLFFACALIYLLVTLGGGLLASTVSHTQQQAMFTIWFFAIFCILTSGYFYPVENMPRWIYLLTYANPMRFFMSITRGIFLKGVQLGDVVPDLIPLFIIGTITFTIAVLRFRKRIA